MTDQEVFKKFMKMMGMKLTTHRSIAADNSQTLQIWSDSGVPDKRITKQGYDEFYSGAIFDSEGNLIKGYLDSHVAYKSDNAKELNGQDD